MASPTLRQSIAKGEFIMAPGVFELVSALIADKMSFKALYVTGYGTVASSLGLRCSITALEHARASAGAAGRGCAAPRAR